VQAECLSSVDVTGIREKSLSNLPLCTVGAVIHWYFHPVCPLWQGSGNSLVNQLKHFTPPQFGNGKQRLETPEGYFIPISIRNGLPYIDMYPPSDKELDSYPHVNFTSDMPWNPLVLEDEYDVQDPELSDDDLVSQSYHPEALNKYGYINNYNRDDLGQLAYNHIVQKISLTNRHIVDAKQHDYKRLAPNFCFVPEERIKKTIDNYPVC
jgi:hypothetical protein